MLLRRREAIIVYHVIVDNHARTTRIDGNLPIRLNSRVVDSKQLLKSAVGLVKEHCREKYGSRVRGAEYIIDNIIWTR